MPEKRQYVTSFASKGALLSDVKTILRFIDTGETLEHVREAVITENVLDRGTLENRRTVWREVNRRYFSGRSPAHITTLAKMVSRCPNPAAANLVLHYEYGLVDALFYDLTAYCVYPRYQNAYTFIANTDLEAWLEQQKAAHPEIESWAPTTRNRVIRSYLATIRDFGLVTGTRQKEFHKLYVPREAFVYALYHKKERGLEGKALIQSLDWRLFLLTEHDVRFMLDDAARGGFVHFQQAGDIYDLRFIYKDLGEVVNALTGK